MKFLKTLKEVFLNSLPLLITIIVLCVFIFPLNGSEYVKVFLGYAIVVLGQTIFMVGLDNSILPIGKLVGQSLTKLRKLYWFVLFGLIFGTVATIAEPSIAVLANQIHQIYDKVDTTAFIWIASLGVGLSVAFGLFAIVKNLNIKWLFAISYICVFIIAFCSPNQFIGLAFDAAGASTGDVSVQFILAFGVGITTTASKSKSDEDTFGLIGIASIGSIVTVLIYGMIIKNNPELNVYISNESSSPLSIILSNAWGSFMAIAPIVVIFLFFQFIFIKLSFKKLRSLLFGTIFVWFGLTVFLIGIDLGFTIAGEHIGASFMKNPTTLNIIFLILVAMLLGYIIALVEPAVNVLGEQVEEITNGSIKKGILKHSIAIGIALAALFSIINILTPKISILWTLAPLYAIALIMMIWTPKLFVGIAFDSAGVTGGAITSAFLIPLTLGVCNALGYDVLANGFGIIGYISALPLISVNALGIIYKVKLNKQIKAEKIAQEAENSEVDDLLGR
jgi:hypothetical protein